LSYRGRVYVNAHAKIQPLLQMSEQRSLPTLVRSVIAFLLADGLGVIGAVLLSIVLARFRGAGELGVFSFSMAQGLLLQLFVEANFAITLPQQVARTGRIIEPLRETQITKWYLALVGVPVGLVMTVFLGRVDALVPTVAAFAVMVIHSFIGSYHAVLHGLGQMSLLGRVIAGSSTLGALCGIAAIVIGVSLPLVIVFQGLGTAVPAWIWSGLLIRRWEPAWSPWRTYVTEVVRQIRKAGLRATGLRLLAILSQRWYWIALGFVTIGYMRFGVLLLGWVGAAAAVIGAYSAAQRFLVVLRMLPNAFFRVFLPQFSKQPEYFAVPWAVGLSLLVGVPVALVLHVTAPWLIELTFRIQEAVPMLQVMGWAMPGVMLSHLAEAYALTQPNYQPLVVIWAAVVLGIGFLSALWGFPLWGSIAVAFIYVGMETLYAVGVVLLILIRRARHELVGREVVRS